MTEVLQGDNDDEHKRGHHYAPTYDPEYDPLNEREPIDPDLLEWYRRQKEVIFDVVPHSHLDYAWYRDREASKLREVEAFVKTLVVQLFTLEQMITAKEFIEGGGKRLRDDLLAMIRDKRMELIGLYTQPDVYLSPPESMFWNIEFGQKTAKELGGTPPDLAYIPDTFGFYENLPMVLRHAGIKTLIFERGFEQVDTIGALFWWEAQDGSKVLAIPMQGGYSNAGGLTQVPNVDRATVSPEDYYEKQVEYATLAVRSLMRRYGKRYQQIDVPHMLLMNGNDFTKPDEDLPRVLEGVEEKMRQIIPNFKVRMSSLGDYAQRAHESVLNSGDLVSTYKGEMRSGKEHFVLRGIDSARMELKQFLHKVETRINEAGALVSLTILARNAGLVAENEHENWQLVEGYLRAVEQILPVLSHDTISGCGSDVAYPLPRSLMTGSYGAANQVARNASAALANRQDTYGPYRHIEHGQTFMNLLPDARTAIVEVPLQGDIEHAAGLRAFALKDGKESEISVQIIQKKDVRYAVCALPMNGLSSTQVRFEQTQASDAEQKEFHGVFENDFYRLRVLPNGIVTVCSKSTGKEIKGLIFEDMGDRGDEYNFCPVESDEARTTIDSAATVTMLHDGPVFTELQINTNLVVPEGLDGPEGTVREVEHRSDNMVTVPICTKVRLIKGIDRIEFETTVNNVARDHRLRVRFDAPNATTRVSAREPYGMTTREAVPIKGGEGWMEPHPIATSHHQGLLTAGDLTVFAKGLPEYEAIADESGTVTQVALTLFRSVGYLSRGNLSSRPGWAGPGTATPEAQLIGEATYEYAINLSAKSSDVLRQADDYVHQAEHGFAGASINELIKFNGGGAKLRELRPTADGQAVMALISNETKQPVKVDLNGMFSHAVHCDAFGNVIDDTEVRHFVVQPGLTSIRIS